MAVTPSGKDKITKFQRLWLGGYDLSGDSRSFSSAEHMYDEVDLSGWTATIRGYVKGYEEMALRGYQALMNDDALGSFTALKNTPQKLPVGLAFGGDGEPATGDPAFCLPAVQLGTPINIEGGAAAISGVDFIPDMNEAPTVHPFGYVLQGKTTFSADRAASSSVSIDLGAAKSAYAAYLAVFADTSWNGTISIEHSTDDSAFSTLATFSSGNYLPSPGYEFLTATTTVNQYVALDIAWTSGDITCACILVVE